MSMLHYAAMNIQLPRTSSGHSNHHSMIRPQEASLELHITLLDVLLQDLAYLDSSGAQLQKGTCPRPAEDSRYTLKLYLQTLSLSLSVAVYQCIGLFIYTHLLYIYVCMPERNFVKLISHDGYPQIWSVRQINSQCMANSQCRAKTLRPGLCPFYCILLYHLHTSLGLCAVHSLPDFSENVYSTSPSAQCSSVLRSSSSLFQSCPANATWHCLKLCPATQPKGKSSCSTTGTHTQRKYEKVAMQKG